MQHSFPDQHDRPRSTQELRVFYDGCADTYDADADASGYCAPHRCAAALAAYAKDKSRPILDFGCGTGLSGVALQKAGFGTIDGVDLSPGMLAKAETTGAYRRLAQVESDAALPLRPGDYAAVAAVAAFGPGGAPFTVLHALLRGLSRGGLLVLSLDEQALKDPHAEASLSEWLDCGAARLLHRESGPLLSARDRNSCVYVVEKA